MPSEVDLGVACPNGPLATSVRKIGLPVHLIPGTAASFRLHPLRTPRAAAEIGAAAVAVRQIARRHGATVLHANSVRAGLVTRLAGELAGPPAVVHVRDVLPSSVAARSVARALTSRATDLIAISHYVKRTFQSLSADAALTVIDNAVDQQRFDVDAHDALQTRRVLRVGSEAPLLGIVGQITPWKGHETAIRALAGVRSRHPGTTLLVVGTIKFADPGARLDNCRCLNALHTLVRDLDLGGSVVFLGERDDIPRILRALDILLVPSTAEPFGRTVAEAMTTATPVIATSEGGPAELLEHGVSGLLAAPGDHEAWASAIDQLLSDRRTAGRMAQIARDSALIRFATDRHARAVLAVLESAGTRRS